MTWSCSRLDAAQSSPLVVKMSALVISLHQTVKIWLIQAKSLCKVTGFSYKVMKPCKAAGLSCKVTESCDATDNAGLGAKP